MILLKREDLSYKDFAGNITLPLKPFSNKYLCSSLYKISKSNGEYENLCEKYDNDSSSLYTVKGVKLEGGTGRNNYSLMIKKDDIIDGKALNDIHLIESIKILSDMDYRCISHFPRCTEDFEYKCTEIFLSRLLTVLNISEESIGKDTFNDFVVSRSNIIYGLLKLFKNSIYDIINISDTLSIGLLLDEIVRSASIIMVKTIQDRTSVSMRTSGEICYNDELVDLMLDFIVKTQTIIVRNNSYNVTLRNIKKFIANFGFTINNNLILHQSGTVDVLSISKINKLIDTYVICNMITDVDKEVKRIINDQDEKLHIDDLCMICSRAYGIV